MTKPLSKRFETVLSIAIVALFAGVAMFFNAGKLAYFGHRYLNGMNQQVAAHESGPIFAENVWKEEHSWKQVDFRPDGRLTLRNFVEQMFEKVIPSKLRESQKAKANVHIVARHKNGTVFLDTWVHNLRTNAGINWQYSQMGGTPTTACDYIGLSDATITPAATDTTLLSEITANGLTRTLGTATHSSNSTSYTLVNVFTASGTQAAKDAAMFINTGGVTMCFENTFTEASLASGDTLTVTWTITF